MTSVETFKSCTVVVDDIIAIRPLEEDAEVEVTVCEVVGETTCVYWQTIADDGAVVVVDDTVTVDVDKLHVANVCCGLGVIVARVCAP